MLKQLPAPTRVVVHATDGMQIHSLSRRTIDGIFEWNQPLATGSSCVLQRRRRHNSHQITVPTSCQQLFASGRVAGQDKKIRCRVDLYIAQLFNYRKRTKNKTKKHFITSKTHCLFQLRLRVKNRSERLCKVVSSGGGCGRGWDDSGTACETAVEETTNSPWYPASSS